jgi:hypothetical protein
MPRYPNPKNPDPRPGDDGYTRVGCKAGMFTALFLTIKAMWRHRGDLRA